MLRKLSAEGSKACRTGNGKLRRRSVFPVRSSSVWSFFPQAVRAILPPLVGQVITTFKDSALASLISLPDLTFQALEVMAISRMTFEVWISAGAIYLLLGVLCARYGRWLETRESWKA